MWVTPTGVFSRRRREGQGQRSSANPNLQPSTQIVGQSVRHTALKLGHRRVPFSSAATGKRDLVFSDGFLGLSSPREVSSSLAVGRFRSNERILRLPSTTCWSSGRREPGLTEIRSGLSYWGVAALVEFLPRGISGIKVDNAVLGHKNAVRFYRIPTVEYLFGRKLWSRLPNEPKRCNHTRC